MIDLIKSLRSGDHYTIDVAEAADALEAANARIALLEGEREDALKRLDVTDTTLQGAYAHIAELESRLAANGADSARDAERYRWLRDTLHSAKAGGGVEVNDALQVYEQPVPGEEVRIYWYLHTPVGFHEITAATLDDAIDEAIAASVEKGD